MEGRRYFVARKELLLVENQTADGKSRIERIQSLVDLADYISSATWPLNHCGFGGFENGSNRLALIVEECIVRTNTDLEVVVFDRFLQ